MYYNHNLRVKIQDWRNRLYKSTYHQFNNSYYFFFQNLADSPLLKNIIDEAINNSSVVLEQIENVKSRLDSDFNTFTVRDIRFTNESNQAAFLYLLNQHWILNNADGIWLIQAYSNAGSEYSAQQEAFITEYIKPITHYLEDVLEESSAVLYLLEKYKIRIENFLKKGLLAKYKKLDKNYEQLLEDDLRLYLFDNGIDNPFSTPKSASGRADIVGMLDTKDPLVLEIKIFDTERKYLKQRIIDGFNQVVKYSNDYNKNVGYLVTFVFDNKEFQIQNAVLEKTWPQRIEKNGKIFYFIFISLFDQITASNMKEIESVSIDV